jgi:hypothetical protein
MAASCIHMQMSYDLCSLLREDNSSAIDVLRREFEMKAVAIISKAKAWKWNSCARKHSRDLCAEMLIPKHITQKWQRGELRAAK